MKGWGGGGGLNPCPFASREGLGGGLNPCPFASREGFRGASPIMGFRGITYTLASSSAMIAWRPCRNVLAGSAALAEPAWSR